MRGKSPPWVLLVFKFNIVKITATFKDLPDARIKLLIALLVAALPVTAFAQNEITIEGNGLGAAGATLVLPPGDGTVFVCTNVTTCSTSIAAPTGSSGGAQVSHTTRDADRRRECDLHQQPVMQHNLGAVTTLLWWGGPASTPSHRKPR